ncbi:MAG: hypothetical protein J5564_06775, partial [Clostridia bacterium]|nr:hypothetical protein [Clostridia bacterium]
FSRPSGKMSWAFRYPMVPPFFHGGLYAVPGGNDIPCLPVTVFDTGFSCRLRDRLDGVRAS